VQKKNVQDVPCFRVFLKMLHLRTSTAAMSDGMVFSICSNSSDNDDKKKESFEKNKS
jgi:hypothetical protein